MKERWRDHKGEPGFTFYPWMKTVDELEDDIVDLIDLLMEAYDELESAANNLEGEILRNLITATIAKVQS